MRNQQVIEKFYQGQIAKSSNGNLYTRRTETSIELVNYYTVLAYIDLDGDIYVNTRKYSVTTSKIQTYIKRQAPRSYEEYVGTSR